MTVTFDIPTVWLTLAAGLATLGVVIVCASVLVIKKSAANNTPADSTDFTFIVFGLVIKVKNSGVHRDYFLQCETGPLIPIIRTVQIKGTFFI